MITANILVYSDDTIGVPVEDANVRVFTDTGVFVTEGVSNALGEVALLLEGLPTGVPYYAMIGKEGWSFPTTPFTVYDPTPPENDVVVYGHQGLEAAVVVTVVVQTDDLVPVPVSNVRVRVYTMASDLFYTEGLTDSAGKLLLCLPGSSTGVSYILRFFKSGLQFPLGSTQVISVMDPVPVGTTNTFDVQAHVVTLPESTNPRMCRVSGTLMDGSLRPVQGIPLRFLHREQYPDAVAGGFPFPGNPSTVDSSVLVKEAYALSGRDGRVELDLPRGAIMDAVVGGLETPGPTPMSSVYVPDRPAVSLADLMFPYVASVSYQPTSLSLSVGESGSVAVTGLMSDGRVRTGDIALVSKLLSFSCEGLTLVPSSDGTLRVMAGVVFGTYTVKAERAVGTVAPRVPSVPVLSVPDLIVTVV